MGPVAGMRALLAPAVHAGSCSVDLLTCTDRLALTEQTEHTLMQVCKTTTLTLAGQSDEWQDQERAVAGRPLPAGCWQAAIKNRQVTIKEQVESNAGPLGQGGSGRER